MSRARVGFMGEENVRERNSQETPPQLRALERTASKAQRRPVGQPIDGGREKKGDEPAQEAGQRLGSGQKGKRHDSGGSSIQGGNAARGSHGIS